MSSFGDLVKRLRKDRSMTLEQVAKKIGSHKGYVSGIENGKVNPPSVKFIRKFARVFSYDEKDMVRMATIDKAPAIIRNEFRAALSASAPPAGDTLAVPLLNTVDTGYAAEMTGEGRPKALIQTVLQLPRFKQDVQFAITVADASMEGNEGTSLTKGDIVLLAPARKLTGGGLFYVIFRQKGTRRAVLRQVNLENGDRVLLQPMNRSAAAELVSHDDIDAYFRVVGRISVFEGSAVSSAV